MSDKQTKAMAFPQERIEQSILLIREKKVMLDRDLASLYRVETRTLNQTVSRNIRRFPKDFMSDLNRDEIMRISQTVISSPDIKFSKKVRAYTEQDVAMLSSVLRSQRGGDVNIAIMRTFVKLRQMLETHAKLAAKLTELESKYDKQFRVIFEVLNELMAPPEPKRKRIGFGVKEPVAKYRTKRTAKRTNER